MTEKYTIESFVTKRVLFHLADVKKKLFELHVFFRLQYLKWPLVCTVRLGGRGFFLVVHCIRDGELHAQLMLAKLAANAS